MPIEQRADVPELGPIDAIVSVPLASLAGKHQTLGYQFAQSGSGLGNQMSDFLF